MFESQEGEVGTGVFLDVAAGELVDDVPYEIAVRIAAKTEAWENEETPAALSRFEERLSTILDDCPGVIVADDDIQTLPEDDLTLADLRRFRRLDKDYRSLPERAGVPRAAANCSAREGRPAAVGAAHRQSRSQRLNASRESDCMARETGRHAHDYQAQADAVELAV